MEKNVVYFCIIPTCVAENPLDSELKCFYNITKSEIAVIERGDGDASAHRGGRGRPGGSADGLF